MYGSRSRRFGALLTTIALLAVAGCGSSGGADRPAGRGTHRSRRCDAIHGTPGSTAPAGQSPSGVSGTDAGSAGATPSSSAPGTSSGTSSGTSTNSSASGAGGTSEDATASGQSPLETPSTSSPVPPSGNSCTGSG